MKYAQSILCSIGLLSSDKTLKESCPRDMGKDILLTPFSYSLSVLSSVLEAKKLYKKKQLQKGHRPVTHK